MQLPQSSAALTPNGHSLQFVLFHWLRQEQLQPVSEVPLTELAWLEQLVSMVQVKEQFGNPL
jgi:hypothetical protein